MVITANIEPLDAEIGELERLHDQAVATLERQDDPDALTVVGRVTTMLPILRRRREKLLTQAAAQEEARRLHQEEVNAARAQFEAMQPSLVSQRVKLSETLAQFQAEWTAYAALCQRAELLALRAELVQSERQTLIDHLAGSVLQFLSALVELSQPGPAIKYELPPDLAVQSFIDKLAERARTFVGQQVATWQRRRVSEALTDSQLPTPAEIEAQQAERQAEASAWQQSKRGEVLASLRLLGQRVAEDEREAKRYHIVNACLWKLKADLQNLSGESFASFSSMPAVIASQLASDGCDPALISRVVNDARAKHDDLAK